MGKLAKTRKHGPVRKPTAKRPDLESGDFEGSTPSGTTYGTVRKPSAKRPSSNLGDFIGSTPICATNGVVRK